jgi:hypothetical protein
VLSRSKGANGERGGVSVHRRGESLVVLKGERVGSDVASSGLVSMCG